MKSTEPKKPLSNFDPAIQKYVEMIVDILTTIIELFFNKHIVQNFAEKIIENFVKTHLNINL